MAAGGQARLRQARRELVRETVRLIYGEGSLARQARLQAECRRLRREVERRPVRDRRREQSMAWKRLEVPMPLGRRPAMGVRQSGRLYWTGALHQKMGAPARVEVWWDEGGRRLGIRPADETAGLAVSKGLFVSAKAVLAQAAGLRLPVGLTPADYDAEAALWAIAVGG